MSVNRILAAWVRKADRTDVGFEFLVSVSKTADIFLRGKAGDAPVYG